MAKRAGGLAALLGSILVVAWMWAAGAGHASWLAWVNLAVGVMVLGGAVSATTYEEQGSATWPLAGFLLMGMWLFAIATGSQQSWQTWLTFAVSLAFLLLTGTWLLASAEAPEFHPHHRAHA
jgi:hypothetical protein